MKKLSAFFVMGCVLMSCLLAEAGNAIKLGTSKITVNIHATGSAETSAAASTDTDNMFPELKVVVETLSIFSLSEEDVLATKLERNGMTFTAEISVECLQQIGGLRFYQDNDFIGGTQIMLSQERESVFECLISEDYKIEDLQYPDFSTLDLNAWQVFGAIFHNGMQCDIPRNFMTSTDLYRQPWQNMRAELADKIWPEYLASALSGGKLSIALSKLSIAMPEWVINNLKVCFAADAVLTQVRNAHKAGIEMENPPVAAYSFLDSINYAPDVFLMNNMVLPVGVFFKNILLLPDSGINAIGDTPVDKWEKEVGKLLAPAINDCPKLLLDFLAGASYMMQLNEGKPLTEAQLKNISKGFSNDIGKIVIDKNNSIHRPTACS